MTTEELKAAILTLDLKGKNNVIFFDGAAIKPQSLAQVCEDFFQCPDLPFEAVFIAVHVPKGKTLRDCIVRRNPIIASVISLWDRVTGGRINGQAPAKRGSSVLYLAILQQARRLSRWQAQRSKH